VIAVGFFSVHKTSPLFAKFTMNIVNSFSSKTLGHFLVGYTYKLRYSSPTQFYLTLKRRKFAKAEPPLYAIRLRQFITGDALQLKNNASHVYCIHAGALIPASISNGQLVWPTCKDSLAKQAS